MAGEIILLIVHDMTIPNTLEEIWLEGFQGCFLPVSLAQAWEEAKACGLLSEGSAEGSVSGPSLITPGDSVLGGLKFNQDF